MLSWSRIGIILGVSTSILFAGLWLGALAKDVEKNTAATAEHSEVLGTVKEDLASIKTDLKFIKRLLSRGR